MHNAGCFFLLAPMPNIDPRKIGILLVHVSLGMLILALKSGRAPYRSQV
jgi:hypothetical protein